MCENLSETVKSNVDQTNVLSNTNGYIYVQLRNRSRHFRLEKTWRETWCLGVQWLLCQTKKKKQTADAQSKNEWSVYMYDCIRNCMRIVVRYLFLFIVNGTRWFCYDWILFMTHPWKKEKGKISFRPKFVYFSSFAVTFDERWIEWVSERVNEWVLWDRSSVN